MEKPHIGRIAFVVGLVLAALIALFSSPAIPAWAVIVIALLGLVVGLMNIAEAEVMLFLIGGIAFLLSFQVLSAVFTTLALGWMAIERFFALMSIFVAPAVTIVAIRAIAAVARR